jgi:flagellar hook-length control protein FliK
VKSEAPQAPVSGSEKTATTKNRKTPVAGRSSALVRGPSKGSVLFQQLMSARAAARNAGATPVVESEGLKGAPSLAAQLKVPQGHTRFIAERLDAGIMPGAAVEQEKPDTAHKTARAKTSAPLSLVQAGVIAAGQIEAHQKTPAAGKEKKPEATELSKAPVLEARATASLTEPMIRILDLRRADKPRHSSEAADTLKIEGSSTSSKDPAAALPPRPVMRETFTEMLPKPAPAAGTNAQTPLERLREMAGSELVRASTLVLKDGGGEIRLVLKPESLGSVRIRMNVVDNAIEGRIIVDSAAVKHVFDGSVDALRRALTAEGFQMGSLQVSVGGQNTEGDERRRQEQAPAVRKIAAQGFERNVPGVENVSLGDLFVNLFV